MIYQFACRPRRAAALALALAMAGCAIYTPLPLDRRPAKPLAELKVPASTLLPGGLTTHPFDPSDGLDATEVAMLAIAQSPDLKVQRAQAKVTRAQAFSAGLLPDPVVGFTRDRPNAGQVGASTAYTRSLSWDVSSLLTLPSRQTARRRTNEQVDLSLLWSEWQTIAESRLRFARVQSGRALVARLQSEANAVEPLAPSIRAALQRGVVTFDVATTGLTAASEVARQLHEARDQLANREQDLRDLLGLAPEEPLQLVGDVDVQPIEGPAALEALEVLPRRRPDVRALELGYAAQEAQTRAAILGQFPSLSVGVTRAKDNTGISSSGFAVNVSLPLFNANRGAVRVERATREQLRAEYSQRLLTARSEVTRLLATQELLTRREAELAPHAQALEEAVGRATRAFEAHTLDWTVYLALRQSALAATTELITLRQTLADTRIGLTTLLTGDWTSSPARLASAARASNSAQTADEPTPGVRP